MSHQRSSLLSRVLSIAVVAAVIVAAPAQAFLIVWDIDLNGANEAPPNASPGTADALITVDTVLGTMRLQTTFSGLLGTTSAAHIHCCTTAPSNVGVATTVPAFVGFPLGVTSGSMDQTYDTLLPGTWNAAFITNNGGTPAGAEAALAAGLAAGRAYLNIHTVNFGPGEIRGFLQAQTLPIGNIPTLSQWALAGLAIILAIASWFMLRRRNR